jgi:hypothetical protein
MMIAFNLSSEKFSAFPSDRRARSWRVGAAGVFRGGVGTGSGIGTTGSQKDGGREWRGGKSPMAAAVMPAPIFGGRNGLSSCVKNGAGMAVIEGIGVGGCGAGAAVTPI